MVEGNLIAKHRVYRILWLRKDIVIPINRIYQEMGAYNR